MERSVQLVCELNVAAAYQTLVHPGSGGVNIFVGTVRDFTQQRAVQYLVFEAYESMALKKMQYIAQSAGTEFSLHRATLWHALGQKAVTEPVVFVGASAPHRDAAFRACRYMIDSLKEQVPIWKQEHFADGAVWVNAHP